jgi:hypothetical protein
MDNTHTDSRPFGLMAPIRWFYDLCEQWRHGYLLLFGIFLILWRGSVVIVIPILYNTRFNGGLHPVDVLMLMHALNLLWIPACALAIFYILSFALESLNTAEAMAKTALLSSVILALFLMLSLFR